MATFPTPGEVLGGYRIDRLVGRGGMSVVYLAEQLALGRKVALKLLSPELSEDEDFRQRFVRESRLAGGLEHPNIIPVHEAGEVDGLLFIAMRYVEGSDLKALLEREGQLSVERTIAFISQAANALDAAHARGLVHRDVKPGNLLVASGEGPEATEHIYLSDFGLTKDTQSKSRMTGTGSFVGTLDYVAPEQIQGKDVSGRTDLYALACVTYECLTGTPPFERDSDVAVMYAHLQDPRPKVTQARTDVPAAIDPVIERGMSQDPQDRQEDCRAFVKELRAVGSGPAPTVPVGNKPLLGRRRRSTPSDPTTEAPSGPTSPPPAAVVVDPGAVTAPTAKPRDTSPGVPRTAPARGKVAALVALPVVALGAYFLTQGGKEPPAERRDEDPAVVVERDPTPSNGTAAGDDGAASGFPGKLAYLEETQAGSNEFLVVVADPPQADPRRIAGSTGIDWRNRRPDWDAAGGLMAYGKPAPGGGELDLVVVDVRSREVIDQLDEEGAQGSVSVSPDGRFLAFSQTVDGNMDIYMWERSEDKVTRLTTGAANDDSPEWSPDGKRLVYESEGVGGNDIFIMDTTGKRLQRVTDTPNINEKLPEFNPIENSLVVYHQQEGVGDFGIYVHDLDDPMLKVGTKIIDTPAQEMRPTWSPDGRFIAFDSDSEGNLDVFLIPFDGLADPVNPGRAVQLTTGPHAEQSPAWAATS